MKTTTPAKKPAARKTLRPLRAVASRSAKEPAGIAIGTLAGLGPNGRPLVTWPGSKGKQAVEARTTQRLRRPDVGRPVALLLVPGAPPLVVGKILEEAEIARPVEVELDGEKLLLTGDREIVLRCGKATLTLTREGKVLIKGSYLLSRSSGVNRIKGGAVEIN